MGGSPGLERVRSKPAEEPELSIAGVADLIAGSPDLDLVASERILATLRRQTHTTSGYPRLRPSDCALLTAALAKAVISNGKLLLLGDPGPVQRLDAILDVYSRTDVRFYPHELFQARMVHARARILIGDFAGARAAVGHYLDNPYALEGGFKDLLKVFTLDCRLRAMEESPQAVADRARGYALALLRLRPEQSYDVLVRLGGYIGLGSATEEAGLWLKALHAACRGLTAARRGAGVSAWTMQQARTGVYGAAALGVMGVLSRSGRKAPGAEVLATRAMGGIGDLVMMTPGLRALAKRSGKPVRFAVPRKFFAVFDHNPHVELLDIDQTPFDLDPKTRWRNLSMCPAGAYESKVRPFVKKSRVELFARGIGVRPAELDEHGWHVEVFLDEAQKTAAQAFLAARGLGGRPLVGVQPYSRDSYKDHPGIIGFIGELARDYDVIVFHHTDAGLPSGPGIATTAGLPLSQSLALVARLQAMVACDSAFLHAAGAFDVPVFALFGPTDGEQFTRHHKRATVFQNKADFPCSPCWRNEDLPCTVTGRVGISPCVSSLPFAPVRAAVDRAVGATA